jgi:hypothetical protein
MQTEPARRLVDAERPNLRRRAARLFVFIVPRSLQVPLCLMLGGAFTAVCLISLVVGLTWQADGFLMPFVWTGVVAGILGLIAGFFALRLHCIGCGRDVDAASKGLTPARCQEMFLRYQIGTGFTLLLLGIVNVFVFAGLAHRLWFDSYTPPLPASVTSGSGPAAALTETQIARLAQTCSLRIILALNMAILGALFFIANSLHKLRICHRRFDSNVFWGGLWYRIGEAVLFTLVFLLVIHWRYKGDLLQTSVEYDLILPLLALMLGMFIKTGERIVFGSAERVFAAASAIIPIQPEIMESNQPRHVPMPADGHSQGQVNGSSEEPIRGAR